MAQTVFSRWNKAVRDARPDEPLATLAAVLTLGVVLAWIFGIRNPGVSSELLIGVFAATVLTGGLAGFLFGLPRFQYSSAPSAAPASHSRDAASNTPELPAAGTRLSSGEYAPSTNLDEIANWLTKIILGATLVEVKSIGTYVREISEFIVAPCAPGCSQFGRPFVASIIVLGFTAGFLFGYLWTRLHYGGIAALADVRIFRIIAQKETELATRYGVGGTAAEGMTDRLPSEVADTEWLRSAASSDPNKNLFGGSPVANARIISATFAPAESRPGITKVTLSVKSQDRKKPLGGNVTFELHPTFKQKTVTCPVIDGAATLTVLAWGAFTVGAIADEGQTRLELDLAELPNAPTDFRLR